MVGRAAARALTWPVAPALMLSLPVDAFQTADAVGYLAIITVSWGVGVFLTWHAFSQGAGWAFLGLGTALTWSGYTDEVAGGDLLLAFGESSYAWWFMFLALGLQFTPTTEPRSRARRWLMITTILSTVGYQLSALLRSTPIEGSGGVVSPWAVESLSGLMSALAFVSIITLGLCLLASVGALVLTFRRATGDDRRRLFFLVAGAAPLAPCVIASFVVAYAGHDDWAGWFLIPAVISLAVGAAFSVLKYRLYDVERIVSDSTAYALASGAVIASFALVVIAVTRSLPMIGPTSQFPTIVATLAAVAVARPAYLWSRDRLDRRFNRRQYDAVRMVRTGLASPMPDLDRLMSDALGDPALRILFPAGQGTWVTSDGQSALPAGDLVEVVRRGEVAAQIEFDPELAHRFVVMAVADEAATEIDNLGLRAELARQVEEIKESRNRLAGAHLEERRRMERDLHDGAQQRILAIALQLQSARVNGADGVLREEVDQAITDLGLTVQELRDLAAGLQPAALAGGGLVAAVEDLRSRLPLRIQVDVVDRRFAPEVEAAGWFVIAEAVSNAVKHAVVDEVSISVAVVGDRVQVAVTDGGIGNADVGGRGLQGLSDRVAALGGSLQVRGRPGGGTSVEAELPCA